MWRILRGTVFASAFMMAVVGGAVAGQIIVVEGGSATVDSGAVVVLPAPSGSGSGLEGNRGSDVNLQHNATRARDYANPAATQGGSEVIVIAPDPLAPATSNNRSNERVLESNTGQAREYAHQNAVSPAGNVNTVVIVPGGDPGSTLPPQTLQHSRTRAKSYANGGNGGQTILIVPKGDNSSSLIDNATRVEMNTDKARSYVGSGGNHSNCSNAQVIVGRIEGGNDSGRVSSVVTGSDAFVSGTECQ